MGTNISPICPFLPIFGLILSTTSQVYNGKVYVHIMPWFETKASSGNNAWGIHWTMANQNPDIIDGTGKRQIAANYYPDIGPYASGDPNVIEYQLLLMKYCGVTGVLIDWPGTLKAYDYPKNLQNAELIIKGTQKYGLEFAIVYEDHNIGLAAEGGLLPGNDKIKTGQNDMTYIRDNYFTKPNYSKINGQPLLMDFGPQTLTTSNDWTQIFTPFRQKPTFLTLWYQSQQAQGSAQGEFAWIFTDFKDGIANFYKNRPLGVKFGVAYQGFNTFYKKGGKPGPTWTLPNLPAKAGPETFGQLLDLAIQNNIQFLQIATWNDYGEGTMIEPTREFGTSLLTTLQKKKGVPYTETELNLIKTLYTKRTQFSGNPAKNAQLDQVSNLLIQFKPVDAAKVLQTIN